MNILSLIIECTKLKTLVFILIKMKGFTDLFDKRKNRK